MTYYNVIIGTDLQTEECRELTMNLREIFLIMTADIDCWTLTLLMAQHPS